MLMIEWFDDLTIGMKFKTGEAQITAPEIKRFAAEFDPQPMHLDEATAAETLFKGLAASGWHTAGIAMRLLVEARPFGRHPIIGLGGEVRWMAPVRPGDVLRMEGEVKDLTPSTTKPQGTVVMKWTMSNQHGLTVYEFRPITIVPRRPET
ncbi:MaoC family dehydratase [Bradyrhizobium elkanii]|uniref:MaoC family dehydratase n=1 Tax=Bradyrhizobium elkanii TaxID=29448 RepID=UPI003D1CE9A0